MHASDHLAPSAFSSSHRSVVKFTFQAGAMRRASPWTRSVVPFTSGCKSVLQMSQHGTQGRRHHPGSGGNFSPVRMVLCSRRDTSMRGDLPSPLCKEMGPRSILWRFSDGIAVSWWPVLGSPFLSWFFPLHASWDHTCHSCTNMYILASVFCGSQA